MADEFTTNYGFVKPDDLSLMRSFETYMNGNWTAIEGVVAPPSITGTLPQSGSYNLYDRVYRTDDQSIYILIVKDVLWGWHWRPVHAAISPWIQIRAFDIFENAAWNNPGPSNLQVAYDNKGQMHWRGFLQRTSAMVWNTTEAIFKDMPKGIYPSRSFSYVADPVTAAVTASGFGMVQYARLFFSGADRNPVGTIGDSNVRLFGGDSAGTQPSNLFFNFDYAVGASWFRTF